MRFLVSRHLVRRLALQMNSTQPQTSAPAMVHANRLLSTEAIPDCQTTTTFSQLSKEKYWKKFYEQQRQSPSAHQDKSFEWIASYEVLKPFILPLMPKQPYNLLDVGCGVSTIAIDLCRDSPVPSQSLCMDISQDALITLQERLKQVTIPSQSHIEFMQGDVLDMPLESASMDIIIDKGTIDSFLKDDNRVMAKSRARQLYKECLRVLKPSGCLIQVTDEDPEMRMPLLNPYDGKDPAFDDLKINYRIVDGEVTGKQETFVYTIKKRKPSAQ